MPLPYRAVESDCLKYTSEVPYVLQITETEMCVAFLLLILA